MALKKSNALFLSVTFFITAVNAADKNIMSGDMSQQTMIAMLYQKFYGAPFHYVLTKSKWPSILAGLYADSRISSYAIPEFVKKYGIDVNEMEKDLTSYTTFNEFFVRKLKKDARPITQGNCVACPADGKILVIPRIDSKVQFPIKGASLSLHTMLGDTALTDYFKGGSACIVRLSPWDYHRVHFPLDGIPGEHRVITGRYESVNPLVYATSIQPLEVNERHLIIHATTSCGNVALLPVGALFVGAITETYTPSMQYAKGDELGYFSFGGSTIVLLFKAGAITFTQELIDNSACGIETAVKVGQSIGRY